MKPYTVRYAHLESLPKHRNGDVFLHGDLIGRMGSTGQSKHNHLHIDLVSGLIDRVIRLSEIGYEDESYKPNIRQLNFFIDRDLFDHPIHITTYFYEPQYKSSYGKHHPAYDVVPEDRHVTTRHFNIYWNRTRAGIVLNTGFDKGGYGYYILVGFEA